MTRQWQRSFWTWIARVRFERRGARRECWSALFRSAWED
jgi:hypothetical protein